MSTLKLILLASFGATSLVNQAGFPVQGGTDPIKINGPKILAPTSSKSRAAADGTYTYTVTLNQAVGVNTVVYVTDLTDAAEPTVYSITIPANTISGTFQVVAAFPGDDVLTAYTANSSDSIDVTVL